MNLSNKIWLSGIFLLCVLLIIFLVYMILLKEPNPFKKCHEDKAGLWDESCTHIQEKKYDPSLKSPEGISPVLINFSNSVGLNYKPFYLPVWYRFRYVNSKTGGYSRFSSWTKSPIISGGCCLPCPEGPGKNCPFLDGYDSCDYNKISIGVPKNQVVYYPGQEIYMNLHRYTGSSYNDNTPPGNDVQDEIVGVLLAQKYLSSDNVKYFYWIDVLSGSPCDNGCDIPVQCYSEKQGCTTCK